MLLYIIVGRYLNNFFSSQSLVRSGRIPSRNQKKHYMHFAMGAKNGLTLWCTSMSRHVMSKNALDSRIKEGTLGPLAPQICCYNTWRSICALISQDYFKENISSSHCIYLGRDKIIYSLLSASKEKRRLGSSNHSLSFEAMTCSFV